MQDIPIFVINLAVQPDRHSYMMAALAALDLDFIHVPAVDGNTLTTDKLQAFSFDRSGYRWATGEIGCLMSHASVWQRMVDQAIPLALIFEDDVRIARRLPEFLAEVDALPPGLHAVKLETLNFPVDIDLNPAGRIGPVRICRLRSKHLGSAGYLLTLEGAKAFLDVTRAPRRPVDHHMFDPLLAGHRHLAIYQAVPALAVQRGRRSRRGRIPSDVLEPRRYLRLQPPPHADPVLREARARGSTALATDRARLASLRCAAAAWRGDDGRPVHRRRRPRQLCRQARADAGQA